jgi:hypothetical protein
MSTISNKNLVAGDTIVAYSLLKLGASGTLIPVADKGDYPVAVATNAATTTNPSALTYELLEPGKIVDVMVSGAINALAGVACDDGPKAKSVATAALLWGQACSASTADGQVIPVICLISAHLKAA